MFGGLFKLSFVGHTMNVGPQTSLGGQLGGLTLVPADSAVGASWKRPSPRPIPKLAAPRDQCDQSGLYAPAASHQKQLPVDRSGRRACGKSVDCVLGTGDGSMSSHAALTMLCFTRGSMVFGTTGRAWAESLLVIPAHARVAQTCLMCTFAEWPMTSAYVGGMAAVGKATPLWAARWQEVLWVGRTGHRDFFALGTDKAIWRRYDMLPGAAYSAADCSIPPTVVYGNGRYDVFARGLSNAVFQCTSVGNAFSPWTSLGGALMGPPSATAERFLRLVRTWHRSANLDAQRRLTEHKRLGSH